MPDTSPLPADTLALIEALERYSHAEIVEMLAHVLKAYVVDGVAPHTPEYGAVPLPTHLRELSFPQLVAHLKMHLALPELERFSVSGREVMVRIGEREYSLTDPNTALPPREHQVAGGAVGSEAETAATPVDDPPDVPESEVDERFRMLEFD